MANNEMTTKIIIEGDSSNMISETNKAKASIEGLSLSAQQMGAGFLAFTAALGSLRLGAFVSDATQLAARVDMLGTVMTVVGNNAGYTSAQMTGFEKQVAAMGITTQESRNSLVQMAGSQMDLTKAAELARIAQDAGRIGNINSSEAFGRLIQGVRSGELEILKHIGINVQFEEGYKKTAATLGKTADKLSSAEKMTSRMNQVLEFGKNIAGTYEASMSTVGGQMSSLARQTEEVKLKFGEVFTPSLVVVMAEINKSLREMNSGMADNKAGITSFGQDVARMTSETLRYVKKDILEASAIISDFKAGLYRVGSWAAIPGMVAGRETYDGMVRTANGYTALAEAQRRYIEGMKAVAGSGGDDPSDQKNLYLARAAAEQRRISGASKRNNDKEPLKGKDETSSWAAADEKYLDYLRLFNANKIALAKSTRDRELYENEQGYAGGLVSLSVFLENKRKAIQDESDAELKAAKDNLSNRQTDLSGKTKKGGYTSDEAKQYHDALQEVEKATASLTTAESRRFLALSRNDSESKQLLNDDAISKNASLSHWSDVYNQNKQDALDSERGFLAQQAAMRGDSTLQSLMEIDRESQHLHDTWAMNTSSFEEYERRKQAIAQSTADKRKQLEQQTTNNNLQQYGLYTQNALTLSNNLYTLTGKKNKELFVIGKGISMANTAINTAEGVMKAYAQTGIFGGPIAAGIVAAAGIAQMAVIASQQPDGGGSTSSGSAGGSYSTSPGATLVTQPIQTSQQQSPSVTVQVHVGNLYGTDAQQMTKWVEDVFAPSMREALSRGVNFTTK